jgi:GST-like protein
MQPSIELYGAPTGNCFRAAIAFEEAGLAYVAKRLNLNNGDQRRASYLSLNPAGRVPTLVEATAGKPPFVLSQSNAIMLYASEKAPGKLLPAAGRPERAVALERLLFFITDVIAPNHAAFYVRPRGQIEGAALLEGRSLAALETAERYVSSGGFMAGQNFSLADIAAFTIAMAVKDRLPWDGLPGLSRWFSQVEARPSVVKGLAAFG